MVTFLAVLNAIAALPQIIKGFQTLAADLEAQFGPDWPARIEQLRSASDLWQKSQSTEERTHAAQALAAAFNSHK